MLCNMELRDLYRLTGRTALRGAADVGPIHIGGEFFAGHLSLAFALHLNGQLWRTRFVPIRDIAKMTAAGPATLRELVASIERQAGKEGFEVHGDASSPNSDYLATPLGDFTEWCKPGRLAAMVKNPRQMAVHRCKRLGEWIEKHHGGNQSAFAAAIGKSQPQIADMLRGEKSFGEKVARDIEGKARMPHLYLDSDQPPVVVRESVAIYGLQISREAALFAQEWEKLSPGMREIVSSMVEAMVAKERREVRKKNKSDEKRPDA